MLGKSVKTIVSWGLALVIALACANLITFFYRSGSGSIPRTNAFSDNIRTPNSRIVRGSEGYGVNSVDENGYLNASALPLSENYILLLGSSHAEGLQVMQNQNMVSVLNDLIDPNVRTVYNMGTAGYALPAMIKGFQAGIEEFPHSAAVIFELPYLSFLNVDLIDALDQPHFDPASAGTSLLENQSLSRKVRNGILEALPIISLLRQQADSVSYNFDGAFGIQSALSNQRAAAAQKAAEPAGDAAEDAAVPAENPAQSDQNEAYQALDRALALIRSEYENPIIIVYHPNMILKKDGTVVIGRDERLYDVYLRACENNDITFIDCGHAFLKAYEADYSLPYGFQNTRPGIGHLNATGHRIVAEELYSALVAMRDKEKK